MLKDEPMTFGEYEPKNYNHEYAGEVPMYEAVKDSKNVSAVWLLNEIGIEKGINSTKRFGIPLQKGDRNLSLALGGLEQGVSPLVMAEAYSVFPNNGVKIKAHVIKKIVDAEGNIIGQWKEKREKVTSKSVTDHITTMLLGVVEYGSGKSAQISGREIAGKTGSTQVPIEGITGVKDQWFVGYSPQLVGAVWVGYDKTDEKHYLKTTSGAGAAILFREVMKQALQGTPSSKFNVPHIDTLIEKKQEEEAEQSRKSLEEYFNDGPRKWEERWKKQKEKWEKRWKKIGPNMNH